MFYTNARSAVSNFKVYLLYVSIGIFQIAYASLSNPSYAGGTTDTTWTSDVKVTCSNVYGNPQATGKTYWKSVSIGIPPYPTVVSDFFLNFSRKDIGTGGAVDVGFDHKSVTGNAGSVTLIAEALSKATGTYRGLTTISTNSSPQPKSAQEIIVCR